MMSPYTAVRAARMFHSRDIDELAEALAEDDDAPDGAGFVRHRSPSRTAPIRAVSASRR